RDVASAQEDKILIVNRATTFAQEAVNLAEGDAAAMIESARAFKDERVLQAEGDVLAFTLREKEYRRAPDLTRFRLHLEALEEILPASQRILRPGSADVKDFDLWQAGRKIGRAHVYSSHGSISYAVFCLKKKKNTRIS